MDALAPPTHRGPGGRHYADIVQPGAVVARSAGSGAGALSQFSRARRRARGDGWYFEPMVAQDAPFETRLGLLEETEGTFGELAGPFRRELLVHCYRMLGSIDDAEDAVQDALVRAWRGRHTFQRPISLRAWLYRIATNACLDAIERRKRSPAGEEHLGVGPIPDDLLADPEPGPEARYDARESISLAFLTVLQLLPPRQRAVLILRDVLSWQAAEVADLLDVTVPAVNSALHRARTAVSRRYGSSSQAVPRAPTESGLLRSLLERYVKAWESADVAGLVALLREDAIVAMPPGITIAGSGAIGIFLADSVFGGRTRVRLVPVRANGGPGFVIYSGSTSDVLFRAYAVQLVDLGESGIARISVFTDQRLVTWFGLPEALAV